jgi:DNA-binding response OmpR family regulator
MKILIIDDDADLAAILKSSFEQEGFVADVANQGDQGSFIARTASYHLIILDRSLPKKGGLEVCREIRTVKSTPIIMLSVDSDPSIKTVCLDAGADDYVTKPFSFEELLARVRAILRRPQKVEEPILTFGGLELDPEKHLCRKGAEEIYLTRKEFLLLHYLMTHAGHVVSRTMIMEHVWDAEVNPFSNTIEVHIQNLRQKIGDGDTKRLIRTIPGRGYKMDID